MSCNISELWHSSSYKYKKILFILIKCELKASFLKKHLSYQYSIYCLILIFKILNSISLLIIYLIIKGLQRISFWLFILSPWYHSQKNQILMWKDRNAHSNKIGLVIKLMSRGPSLTGHFIYIRIIKAQVINREGLHFF